MSKADEDHVADVGREESVIRWILFFMVWNGFADGVLGGEATVLVRAMAKLLLDGIENLLGCGRSGLVGEPVVIAVHFGPSLAKDAVL